MMTEKSKILQVFLGAGAALVLTAGASAAAAQTLDPALVEVRRQKSNPSFSLLAYRHMDEMFDSRTVTPGAKTWKLAKSPLTLADDAPVDVRGKRTTFSQALSDLRINAVLVMKDGKIVKELHRNGGDPTDRYAGFSMSKSWISMLIGIAISQGKIGGVDDPVVKYLPELKGTAYDKVTLRHLLTMRAGTSWEENYAAGTFLDKVRDGSTNIETMFYEDAAKDMKSVAEPGSKFNYSTLETELAGVLLARATGKTVADYMTEVLWKPAGMEAPGYWMLQGPRGRQHEWYGAGFGATVRDFGRLGQLMLDGGKAGGRQIVPAAWVEESTRSKTGDRYFYFWWPINGVDGFAANGVGSQHVYVDRATRTIMVIAAYGGPDPTDLFKSVVKQLN